MCRNNVNHRILEHITGKKGGYRSYMAVNSTELMRGKTLYLRVHVMRLVLQCRNLFKSYLGAHIIVTPVSTIQAYIEPALDSSVRRKSSELATFSFHSVKFLHAFTTHFDRVPDAEVNDVWSVLHGCYRCSKLHQVALKEPLTVEKLLYHMMSKLLKRVSKHFTKF